ncbi:MAG TPA: hypothetical protein VHX66_05265 [Solirubrobacteraceae bacterium]|jgi:hypothetical protein|nr:hypothetical protein [Solirubrobacteraceae bacterium]
MSQPPENAPRARLPIVEEVGAELDRLFRAEEERLASSRPAAWWHFSQRSRPFALIAALLLGGATVALAASGAFAPGAPLQPGAPVIATQDNGAALPASARLLLRVADPHGGLPWGVRVERTTRGETCVEVGRRAFGEIGVLGQDGAFADDSRFHPLSRNYFGNGLGCADYDAHGHAFVNLVFLNVPASGYDGRCALSPPAPGRAFLRAHPILAHGLAQERRHPSRLPRCPTADLRDVFAGLLGPDAASVTYRDAQGRPVTVPTAGSDGAYLIVLPQLSRARLCVGGAPLCPFETMETGTGAQVNREVLAVNYRAHAPCRYQPKLPAGAQPSCPNVGYVAPHTAVPAPAKVASRITVRRDAPRHGAAQVTVSFPSPVAVKGAGDYYYFEIDNPRTPDPLPGHRASYCNPNSAGDFQTYSDYARGQVVVDTQDLPPCRGTFRGSVTLVLNGDFQDHIPGGAGSASRLVGDFTIRVP